MSTADNLWIPWDSLSRLSLFLSFLLSLSLSPSVSLSLSVTWGRGTSLSVSNLESLQPLTLGTMLVGKDLFSHERHSRGFPSGPGTDSVRGTSELVINPNS